MAILVVGDEAIMREMLQDTLEDSDYEVLLARDKPQALDALASREDITHIISDLHLGNESGLDLAMEVHKLAAEIKIIIMTGDDELPAHENLPLQAILLKPFTMAKLLQVL